MKITIGTKNQIFKTIGHTEDFKPVLWFKIGQRKQAIKDLTAYFNDYHHVLATAIQFTEAEDMKFQKQFEDRAKAKAEELIEDMMEYPVMFDNRFFTFLPLSKGAFKPLLHQIL